VCGKPWEREVERETVRDQAQVLTGGKNEALMDGIQRRHALSVSHSQPSVPRVRTLGWRPGCDCEGSGYTVPATILDPFLGSGTTAYVARKHGRRSIGIELNPAYADLAARRMAQQSLEFAL
jgi:hypothetical protein